MAGSADRVRGLLKDLDRVSAVAETAVDEREQLKARAERAEKALEILTGEREAVRALLQRVAAAGVPLGAVGDPAGQKAGDRSAR